MRRAQIHRRGRRTSDLGACPEVFRCRGAGAIPSTSYRRCGSIPSPYMYFLDFPAARVNRPAPRSPGEPRDVGPTGRPQMTVCPICSGTRQRGRTTEEDDVLARELLADPEGVRRARDAHRPGPTTSDASPRREACASSDRWRSSATRTSCTSCSEVTGRVPAETPPLEVLRSAFPGRQRSRALPNSERCRSFASSNRAREASTAARIGYVTKAATSTSRSPFAPRPVQRRPLHRSDRRAGAGIVEASVPASEATRRGTKRAASSARLRLPAEAASDFENVDTLRLSAPAGRRAR